VQHAIHVTVVALILDAVAFLLITLGLFLIYRRKFPTLSVPTFWLAPKNAGPFGQKTDRRPSWLGLALDATGGAFAMAAMFVAHFGVTTGHYPLVQMIVLVTGLATVWGGWQVGALMHNRRVQRQAQQSDPQVA
jgi:hypothetical protein